MNTAVTTMKATVETMKAWVAIVKARITTATTRIFERFERRDKKRGGRVLVNEIMSIQVISAALIGALAVASLYWGGQWVLKDNYSRWALQWTEELNELGAPLYLADDGEALIRLESYVERYPEIDRVAYFAEDGTALVSVGDEDNAQPIDDLSQSTLNDAIAVIGNSEPYIMSTLHSVLIHCRNAWTSRT